MKMNKKAAMEMSVGTIVTIVLLMGVLVLGGVLIQKIFFSATSSVSEIDQAVKNEISKLFNQDNTKKVIIYPSTRLISITKGNQDPLGFAFSIRNTGSEDGVFDYSVTATNIGSKCGENLKIEEAQSWIQAGNSGEVTIPSGEIMADPVFVRYLIPDTASANCVITYGVNVKENNVQYSSTVNVDLSIKGK
jgi:hypothetical protein